MPFVLAPSEIHIWFRFTDAIGDAETADALSVLSDDERTRYSRFVHARDRRDYAEAHALVRRVLSLYEPRDPREWVFENTSDGKPFLASSSSVPPLHFNLSHTHGLVACAVARDMDIGLDVERVERAVEDRSIAQRYFAPAEIDALERCEAAERPRRFIELWALKEAYIKAIGRGLSQSLREFAFELEHAGEIRLEEQQPSVGTVWSLALYTPSDGTRMAVAARGAAPARAITARRFDRMDSPPLAPSRRSLGDRR